jgi:hypothetical protein
VGSNPSEAVGFFRAKKKSSAFLPSEEEVKPSFICRRFTTCIKIPECYVDVGNFQAKFIGNFSPM